MARRALLVLTLLAACFLATAGGALDLPPGRLLVVSSGDIRSVDPGAASSYVAPAPLSFALSVAPSGDILTFTGGSVARTSRVSGGSVVLPCAPSLGSLRALTADPAHPDGYAAVLSSLGNNEVVFFTVGESGCVETDPPFVATGVVSAWDAIAAEPAGTFVLLDEGTNEVHRIDRATGTLTLLASYPTDLPFGVGVRPDGSILVAVRGAGTTRIDRIDPVSTVRTPLAEVTSVPSPFAFTVAPDGSAYWHDALAGSFAELTPTGTIIIHTAPSFLPVAVLTVIPPRPIAYPGDLLVVDRDERIVRVDGGSDAQLEVLGATPELVVPETLAVDGERVFVTNALGEILEADLVDGTTSVVASGSLVVSPRGMTARDGLLWVTDASAGIPTLYTVDPDSGTQTPVLLGGPGAGSLLGPRFDDTGDLFVADGGLDIVSRFPNGTGSPVFEIPPGLLAAPTDVAVDANGDLVVTAFNALAVWDRAATALSQLVTDPGWDLLYVDVDRTSDGRVYATNDGTELLRIDPATGASTELTARAGNLLDQPADLAVVTTVIDAPACANGRDDDGDGLVDASADPGCDDADDDSERSAALLCDNGVDDDGDGGTDFPADPACTSPTSPKEDAQCQDGLDNDGVTGIDFDGGASRNGGVAIAVADPQCASFDDDREAAPSSGGSCGLGPELALLLPALVAWRRRARR